MIQAILLVPTAIVPGQHGFLYTGRNYITLDVPGMAATAGQGINNARQVVGYANLNNVTPL
jgi:hypothetical protein